MEGALQKLSGTLRVPDGSFYFLHKFDISLLSDFTKKQ